MQHRLRTDLRFGRAERQPSRAVLAHEVFHLRHHLQKRAAQVCRQARWTVQRLHQSLQRPRKPFPKRLPRRPVHGARRVLRRAEQVPRRPSGELAQKRRRQHGPNQIHRLKPPRFVPRRQQPAHALRREIQKKAVFVRQRAQIPLHKLNARALHGVQWRIIRRNMRFLRKERRPVRAEKALDATHDRPPVKHVFGIEQILLQPRVQKPRRVQLSRNQRLPRRFQRFQWLPAQTLNRVLRANARLQRHPDGIMHGVEQRPRRFRPQRRALPARIRPRLSRKQRQTFRFKPRKLAVG